METQLVRQLIMKVSSGDICSPSGLFYYRFLNIVRFNDTLMWLLQQKNSMKANMATDEGNSRNEMWHWTNDEIGVAVQSWRWVWVELMAW